MPRDGRHVDFRNVIDADRSGRADECDRGGEIGKPAAVEILIGGEGGDPAACAVDRHAAAHRDGMALDAELELIVAIVGETHRPARREQAGQRDVERIDGVVLAAKGAADIGAVRDDPTDRLLRAVFDTSVATLAAASCGDWTPMTSSSLRAALSYQARPASGSMNTWSIDWVWNVRSMTSRSEPPASISARI